MLLFKKRMQKDKLNFYTFDAQVERIRNSPVS